MISPLKSIRKKCLDCSGYEIKRVKECDFDGVSINRNGLVEDYCPLHPFRMGHGKGSKVKAIRKYCLWCCLDQANEVRLCPSITCEFHPFRFGHNPNCSRNKLPELNPIAEIANCEGVLAINMVESRKALFE